MHKIALALALLLLTFPALSSKPAMGDEKLLIIDVIDVGAGMCMVLQAPSPQGKKIMVYDVGSSSCGNAIKGIIGSSEIDLVVISHPDADHYRGISKAFKPTSDGGYGLRTKAILETGIVRFSKDGSISPTYKKYITAKKSIPTTHSLTNTETAELYKVGKQWGFGDAVVTFIHGHGQVPGQSDNKDPSSHDRNGASIVLKIEYGSNSILLTGDAVGVEKGDTTGQHCIRTEKRIVQSCGSPKRTCGDMNVDVMIAPHHGSHESLCMGFLKLTDPESVIFSAGRSHSHPRQVTYDRLMDYDKNIITFRTDRNEASGKEKEWTDELGDSKKGDDNIRVVMNGSDSPVITYR